MFVVSDHSERELHKFLDGIRNRPKGFVALVFPLSGLAVKYKNPFQLRIVMNLLGESLKESRGGIFQLESYDVVVLAEIDAKMALIEKLIGQVRYLFPDDPLAYTEHKQPNEAFCSLFLLAFEWHRFHRFYAERLAKKEPEQAPAVPPTVNPPEPSVAAVDPVAHAPTLPASPLAPFVMLLYKLEALDITSCLRHQPVCAVMPQQAPKIIFDEIFVSILHLRDALDCPQNYVMRTPLFFYMTEFLDAKLLDLFGGTYLDQFQGSISVNLNVSTLLSPRFTMFDQHIPEAIKKSIILEIHVGDVFTDISAFMLASRQVKEKGYRICLDGLNNFSFLQVGRAALGFDLAKLGWNRELSGSLTASENAPFVSAVERYGANRLILSHCDSPEAVQYGHRLGISLFQGWYLDKLLKEARA